MKRYQKNRNRKPWKKEKTIFRNTKYSNKIVQEIIKIILNVIYLLICQALEHIYGCRPKKIYILS